MSSAFFFNDNNSDSFHHEEINTAGRPICVGQSLSCPVLYRTMDIVSFLTKIFDFIIISFLIYLSFAKVKNGVFKYFTLNTMVICSVITIAVLVIDVINVINLFANVDENLYRIRRWARRCLSFGYIWSHALALYVAIICYLAYVNPIFYVKHFVNKSQKLYYIILHISLFLWNSSINIIRDQFSVFIPYHLTHLILFIALFIVAIMASIKIYKYKPAGVNATHAVKLRRKQLFSFVVYSYAAEIIVMPRFFYSFMSIICYYAGCEYQLKQTVFFRTIRQLIYILHELNSIVVVLSTVVAFEPYRQAVLSFFGKQRIVKIQPLNSMIIGNINNIAMVANNVALVRIRK
ncbi:putative integral membrane protein [Acanthocheilonema viteae]